MYVVLDLETTGLSARDDTIIEYAFVKIDRDTFEELDRLTGFVNPNQEIPLLISQITNIFNEDVKGAKQFHEVREDIQDFIEGFPLIGHNIPFDIRFLESHGIDTSKNPYIDTFFLANILCFDQKSLNLGYLCESMGIELVSAHRAIDDTVATAKLFGKLVGKLKESYYRNEGILWYYFSECQDSGVRVLRNEYLTKPKKDYGLDAIITDYEKKLQTFKQVSVDKKGDNKMNIEEFLGNIPDFELRNSQKIMLDKVDKTLGLGQRLLIEAPTGIGKTFAYLLPAIKHALMLKEPVHISTSTKALQDQIYYKDLAYISEHFPQYFSYTKLKGKRNYLGISSFLEFLHSGNTHSITMTGFVIKIFLWSIESEFGELDELQFYGEEFSFLQDIHAGNSFIFDDANPYKDIEFALQARKRARNSDIIITNNHILFQDIVSEGSLLGGVKNLILDEAHSLEDIVTNSLKKSLGFDKIQKLLDKVDKKLLRYSHSIEKAAIYKQTILFDTAELFSMAEGEIFSKFSPDTKYKNILIGGDFYTQYPEVQVLAEKIVHNFSSYRKDISSLGEKNAIHFSAELQEMQFVSEFILGVITAPNFEQNIYFMSHDDNYGTQLHTTLLHPGEFLKSSLWSKLESVVLTSATLQMQGDFSYIDNTLQTYDFEKVSLESDFDYSKQALLCIPQDLGSIKNNIASLVEFLGKFFHTVGGNTLVLFTAFFSIREVYSNLKIELQNKNINLLAQGISGSKHKQIDFFKSHPDNSILLGTDTFWEGIDIPGKDLQYLIIHKIPFSVPSDPIFMARSKLYKDSFNQYAIPKAILKLKQGFGRLIRTKKDSGIVVFLDDRIYTTKWGEQFLASFPHDIKVRYTNSKALLDLLSKNR